MKNKNKKLSEFDKNLKKMLDHDPKKKKKDKPKK